jgi:hypothetical protein
MPSRKESQSMLGFKERQTLSLGTSTAGDFKLEPMLKDHSKNSKALKNYTKSFLPEPVNKKAKPKGQHMTC